MFSFFPPLSDKQLLHCSTFPSMRHDGRDNKLLQNICKILKERWNLRSKEVIKKHILQYFVLACSIRCLGCYILYGSLYFVLDFVELKVWTIIFNIGLLYWILLNSNVLQNIVKDVAKYCKLGIKTGLRKKIF